MASRSGLQAIRTLSRTAVASPKPSALTARAISTSPKIWNQASNTPAQPTKQDGQQQKQPVQVQEPDFTGIKGTFLKALARITGHYTVGQTAMRSTHRFYEICAEQMNQRRSFWIETCGLPDNFQTWFSVTHLHVWLLMVRIRGEPKAKVFQQQLVNHFFIDMEDRMRYNHKISSNRIIKNYLHDFLAQFHGGVLAYDEGMCKDDPVMAAALWRNLFTSTGNPEQLALLVDYVRKELQILDQMPSDEFLEARILFGTAAPALRGVPGK
ncbi:Protein cbp3, mitochondrial [Actinomortierella ambigua]|nr:Protein cbp3, mitochondrial [Actinomortierella ambigua]